LNRVGLNRVIRYVVPWVPGFGLVLHAGRRTGRIYRTPVTLFVRRGAYVVALTYGRESDWVKNTLAAGGCRIRHLGREVRLVDPRIVHDPARAAARPLERIFLRAFGVADFLVMEPATGPGERRHIATRE
jgi:deazaflavin-dependent oxidoreductase (nitroreductase family)